MNNKIVLGSLLAASIGIAFVAMASPALAQGRPWHNEATKTQPAGTVPGQNQPTAPGQGNRGSGAGSAQSGTGAALPAADPAGLTQAEIDGLLFMREEEKLAHDVYVTLYEQWGLTQFNSIASSEQTHTDAVATLLERYGVADKTATEPGVFVNPDLQALYNDLVGRGSQSAAEALAVGALIEEVDIADLDQRIALTDQADILAVYANLRTGSESHLRAFVRGYEAQAGTAYSPQMLSAETYASILSGSNGNGAGNGTGTGGGNGGGNGGGHGGGPRRP
ncbi:MAG: DUF2202 domain-containing protein [Anaerolineales bacterium]|nr:DUF2202 domain-containing protein [Anaerolineales bacterium]